ncbi:MAG: L-rhamnose mutarotase [Verrucomicrobia bacterium]|nr:L-rhamnose mutarotase [Verrucomicrobiota bacterium]MBV9671719.1 L-rhamnose mutarotase [Verrucomicrobiota bacterium]
MIRKAFVMQLNVDAEEEYRKRHNPIWPELAKTLQEHGVHNYSIFLEKQTGQLFAYAEIEDEERWQMIGQTEVCQRWWNYMASLMKTNPDQSPVAIQFQEMFHLNDAMATD